MRQYAGRMTVQCSAGRKVGQCMGRMTTVCTVFYRNEGTIMCEKNDCCLHNVLQKGRWNSAWEE